ncbi:MAG TPA: energy transducer TonB [Vicinamibacterales bacterium]|nr:energy transducer TonB [Vicinamibacterales bacterium]
MIDLLGESARTIPQHRRVTTGVYVAAFAFHVVLFTAIYLGTRHAPVRMTPGAASSVGIAAYVPGPTGTAGTAATMAPKPAAPKKAAPSKVMRAQAAQEPEPSASGTGQAGAADAQGAGAGSGPVRLGSGGNLTLLNKVKPAYPPIFERARIPGTVVLDAIIHRDGTIGDVKVLQSTNDQFAQAAIAAVKQWRYTPIPYEGIVTVTVNFTAGS